MPFPRVEEFEKERWDLLSWSAINVQHERLTAESVARIRRIGLAVGAWTVNADEEIRRMIALGVDTIISDRPLRVRDICREIG